MSKTSVKVMITTGLQTDISFSRSNLKMVIFGFTSKSPLYVLQLKKKTIHRKSNPTETHWTIGLSTNSFTNTSNPLWRMSLITNPIWKHDVRITLCTVHTALQCTVGAIISRRVLLIELFDFLFLVLGIYSFQKHIVLLVCMNKLTLHLFCFFQREVHILVAN